MSHLLPTQNTNSLNAQTIPEGDLYIDLLKQCLCSSIYDESAWAILAGPMMPNVNKYNPFAYIPAIFKHAVLRALKKRSLMLVQCRAFDHEVRDQGLDWPCFGYTMVGRRRLDNVQACLEDVLSQGVPGDFVETGVWRGGTTILMRALLKRHGIADRKVWCADSFEGLPIPNELDKKAQKQSDFSDRNYLAVTLEQVKANFARFGLLDEQVMFLKGWFCDTLPTAPIERIALLRLDGDLYSSTMDALTSLGHKVSPGGYVIVDDYNSWPACRQAVDEYRQREQIDSEIVPIDPHAVYWRAGPAGK
jgi:O-methyltransferase